MAPSPRKYQGYTFFERSSAGGATNSFDALRFEAPEDLTVIAAHVEIALSMESLEPALGYEHNNIGGIARLVLYPGGATETNPSPNSDWDAVGSDSLNDGDVGDTWALVPFALSSSGTNSTPGHGSNAHVILSPKTKRKLRRQDVLKVHLQYTNSGDDTGTIQEVVTGTLFTLA